jgi:hypothetical protein
MRKKPTRPTASTNTAVSNKTITKTPRPATAVHPDTNKQHQQQQKSAGGDQHHASVAASNTLPLALHGGCATDGNASYDASPARSVSPLESDLLRYLTAHIMPPDNHESSDFCVEVTNFVIGRSEYLQGIVRLVQSDCPEVANNLQHFMASMEDAFAQVSETDRQVFV